MNRNQTGAGEENEGVDDNKGMGRGWTIPTGGWAGKLSTKNENYTNNNTTLT